jgi:hypothetical protein
MKCQDVLPDLLGSLAIMPIQTKCPSCRKSVSVADSKEGKKITCPDCAYGFVVTSAAVRSKPAAWDEDDRPRSRSDGRLQKEPASRPAPVTRRRRDEDDEDDEGPRSRKSRRSPEVARSSGSAVLPLVLIGGGVFVLCLGLLGVGLYLVLVPAKSTSSNTIAAVQNAAAVDQPIVPAGQLAGGNAPVGPAGEAPPIPDVPRAPAEAVDPGPVGEGGEEFVDLPERREASAVVPGLPGTKDPDGPGRPEAPAAKVKVALTGAMAQRAPGLRVTFRVNYKFTEGEPEGGLRYFWVVTSSRGKTSIKILIAGDLKQQGTLEMAATGLTPLDAPYQTVLAIERPGAGRARLDAISDVVSFR